MATTKTERPHFSRQMLRDDVRTGLTAADLKEAFLENLFYGMGRTPMSATLCDAYLALALTVRDRVLKKGLETLEAMSQRDARVVAYFSAEYLPGPHLSSNLLNLGLQDQARQAMSDLGMDLDKVLEQEEEPGLGNGGLGRLASCFMDSLATMDIPAIGYGVRYEFGIFDQVIRDGWQVEITDKWLRYGNPWEIARTELSFSAKFGGRTEPWIDAQGRYRVRWIPDTMVNGVAYDTPILGYGTGTCNRMRLWKAEAVESFDFAAFNHGDYYRAVEDKVRSENLTKVLYPNDERLEGKVLRLQQQFFFVTCSLQDMLRVHLALGRPLEHFHEKWAAQLNDTHPAIAIAELMRLLVDEHLMDWEKAWEITRQTFAYTNHTLLPEALEKWSVPMFARLLPRHLEIIYEINRRFLDEVKSHYPHDDDRVTRLSLIDESGPRYVRMAHLAAVGSHRINGVARLHSELLKSSVLADFADLWPARFCNVTNGISPRRFLALSNPPLAELISRRIGRDWLRDLEQLRRLEPLADEAEFQQQWREVKLTAKKRLALLLEQRAGVQVNPETLFQIQAKRLHEYKRQHLSVLHILTLYLRLKRDPAAAAALPAQTFIFAGKAAPGYGMAKLIIKLINSVAEVVNQDHAIGDRLKVAFFPDFNVTNAQPIYPAADVSQQISLAGKEASGTGNMKFAANGALTIGTLDGANVEIREAVGTENFFLFGLTVEQVQQLRAAGYRPGDIALADPELRAVLDFINSGALAGGDGGLFRPLLNNLLWEDPFMVLADYAAYLQAQARVAAVWQDQPGWTRKSILNVARIGRFSSDRSIRDYASRIWNVQPLPPPPSRP